VEVVVPVLLLLMVQLLQVEAVVVLLELFLVLVAQVLLFSNGIKKCQSLHRLAQHQFVHTVL
jgi:hypothetical protein